MCVFLILFTALIYLMHFPHVHKKRTAFPLHVSHQATDWAITAGDALKRLKKETHRLQSPLHMWQFI